LCTLQCYQNITIHPIVFCSLFLYFHTYIWYTLSFLPPLLHFNTHTCGCEIQVHDCESYFMGNSFRITP
jgi:hypothetical protein